MIYSKLFDEILAKPGLYVGHRSIIKIKAFIDGYIHAKLEAGEPVKDQDELFFGFTAWVATRFGIKSSHDWASIIQFASLDENYAFEQTKKLWGKYKAEFQQTKTSNIKLLVSACLLGSKVRYDNSDKASDNVALADLMAHGQVISVCPEVAGGLGVPRLPAEIQHGDGAAVLAGQTEVVDSAGKDVTNAFVSGAQQALALAQAHNIKVAILKARSPSCGNQEIYDGTFSKSLRNGQGVTAALLEQHGIKVFNEAQIDEALTYAAQLAAAQD